MIALLQGTVAALGADHAVIDVAGVGYLVQASARTLGRLGLDQRVRLLVETQVREDAITLFGFFDAAERDWFRHLTGVQAVGGRVALAILSTLSPAELARAIALEDRASLARAPGVGAKLAARLVTELRGVAGPTAPADSTAAAAGPALPSPAAAARDALSALASLGFRGAEAAAAVAAAEAALGEGAETAALVREALRRAAR